MNSNFKINCPDIRGWMDFSSKEGEVFYPVNIKVSTTKTTDNLNCKLGIYYALTGKIPSFNNTENWETYFKTLKESLATNDKDYYFLIINKDKPDDVFATSLKCLKSILPNGNNLPFQAKWDNNRQTVERSFAEAKAFLLGCFAKSLKLRAEAYSAFKTYFVDMTINENEGFDFYAECDYCKKTQSLLFLPHYKWYNGHTLRFSKKHGKREV